MKKIYWPGIARVAVVCTLLISGMYWPTEIFLGLAALVFCFAMFLLARKSDSGEL